MPTVNSFSTSTPTGLANSTTLDQSSAHPSVLANINSQQSDARRADQLEYLIPFKQMQESMKQRINSNAYNQNTCAMRDVLNPEYDLGALWQQDENDDHIFPQLNFETPNDSHHDNFNPAVNNPFDKHDPYSFKSVEEVAVFRTALQNMDFGTPSIANTFSTSGKNGLTVSRNKTAETVRKYRLQVYIYGHFAPDSREQQLKIKGILNKRFGDFLEKHPDDKAVFNLIIEGKLSHQQF